jgi:predicted Fe-Mo cluster-binding NifX family protein
MKIALPTDDRRTIAGHFGRCAEFAVYEIVEQGKVLVEYRPNTHIHGHQERGGHAHDFGTVFGDVDCVICRGMGRRALEVVGAAGAKPVYTGESDIERAVEMFAAGELDTSDESLCEKGEGHDH